MLHVEVVGVRLDRPHNAPVLLLREKDGERHLPIWIAATEASAIVSALEDDVAPRPMTHDLLAGMIDQLGHVVEEVMITHVDDGVFHAQIHIDNQHMFESRPSDAVALAVRCQAPITCSEEVLDAVGVRLTTQDEEMKRFRAFLENVNPEDFGS